MINGHSINGAAINGQSQAATSTVERTIDQAYKWSVRVEIDGVDWSDSLTGTVSTDREEGAAGVASFDLVIEQGVAITPASWIGKLVQISITTTYPESLDWTIYTGRLEQPTWDAKERVLSFSCSDQRLNQVEAMTIEEIDSLIGGFYNSDILGEIDGFDSHADYAEALLSTIPASMDASPNGYLRTSSWFSKKVPDVRFVESYDESLSVELTNYSERTNRVEISLSYRYARLWQWSQRYTWEHPDGGSGNTGFCAWRQETTQLPTTDMVSDAVSTAGMSLVYSNWGLLPKSGPNICGNNEVWINTYDNLLLDFDVIGAVRFSQQVTESYTLALSTGFGSGTDKTAYVTSRVSYAISEDTDDAESEWNETAASVGDPDGYTDLSDAERLESAWSCVLSIAQAELIGAMRNRVTFGTSPVTARGVDLPHTVELDELEVNAVGKCRRVQHRLGIEDGDFLALITISPIAGNDSSEIVQIPSRPDASAVTPDLGTIILPTQIGGGLTPGEYDDSLDGVSVNYGYIVDAGDDATINNRGEWFEGIILQPDDLVTYEGTAYLYLWSSADFVSNTPPDEDYANFAAQTGDFESVLFDYRVALTSPEVGELYTDEVVAEQSASINLPVQTDTLEF